MSPLQKTLGILGAAAAVGVLGLALGLVPGGEAIAVPAPHVVSPPPPLPQPPPLPPSSDTLRVTASLSHGAVLQGGDGQAYLNVEIVAKDAPGDRRVPVNLALVIDRSGSMHGEKLENAKAAARRLVDGLDEQDQLAIVAYGSAVEVIFSSAPATEGNKAAMRGVIARLWDSGGTNLSGGLSAGVREVQRARSAVAGVDRVILISDGQANEGITTRQGLGGLARRTQEQGISVSTIGVGLDFNEDVMQDIAELAAGRYHYLREAGQLAAIFTDELRQTAATVARAPSLTVALPDGVQVAEVYGYKFERRGDAFVVDLPDLYGGARRKLVARVTVPTSTLGPRPVAGVKVGYTDLLRDRSYQTATAPMVVAEVSSQPEVVAAREDKHVLEQAVRVNNASALRKAADLFGSGNSDEAQKTLAGAAVQARVMNERIGSPKLEAESTELDRRLQDFGSFSAGDDAGRDAVKASKSRANELSW